MTSPQKRILLLSSGALPAAALAAYLLAAPQMAKAGPYCVYAGQNYSTGACLASCPDPNQRQRCDGDGSWSSCTWC